MKKLVLAFACLAAVPVTSLALPTVYSYTGEPYTSITDVTEVPGTYTTGMRITGSVTLSEAVPLGSFVELTSDDPRVLGYSFNDGRIDFNDSNSFSQRLLLSVSASGMVAGWEIVAIRASPMPGLGQADFLSRGNCAGGFVCDIASLSFVFPSGGFSSDQAENFVAGSWTITAVPEPEASGLMLAGIFAVVLAIRRQNRN
jgi:hypothetical protein